MATCIFEFVIGTLELALCVSLVSAFLPLGA